MNERSEGIRDGECMKSLDDLAVGALQEQRCIGFDHSSAVGCSQQHGRQSSSAK